MNRIVISLVLSTFALGAFAQTPAPDAAVQVQGNSGEVTVITGDADKVNDRNCLRETGSHIVSKDKDKKKCVSTNGQAYTREDIDRTGTTDLGDALRHLDTSVRIRHN